MRTILPGIAAFLFSLNCHAELITEPGSFSVSGSDVRVEVSAVGTKQLSVVACYPDRSEGGFSAIEVVERAWIVYFESPNRLWIYDGDDEIHLSERTDQPRGFKGTSSSKVPTLWERLPEELKQRLVPVVTAGR